MPYNKPAELARPTTGATKKSENYSHLSLRLIGGLVLLMSLALPSRAHAHMPVCAPDGLGSFDQAFTMPYPTISWAIYGRLLGVTGVSIYQFQAEAGTPLFTELLVPVIPGLEQHTPAMALIGPGLPPPRDVPLIIPTGLGARTAPTGARTQFYEPHGGRSYWRISSLRIAAPASGTYYVMVWSPSSSIGKYTLALGEREIRPPTVPAGPCAASWWNDAVGPLPIPAELPATGSSGPRGWMWGIVLLVGGWLLRHPSSR